MWLASQRAISPTYRQEGFFGFSLKSAENGIDNFPRRRKVTAHIDLKVQSRDKSQLEDIGLQLPLSVVDRQGADIMCIILAGMHHNLLRLLVGRTVNAEIRLEKLLRIEALKELEATVGDADKLHAVQSKGLQADTLTAQRLLLDVGELEPLHGKEIPTALESLQRMRRQDAVVGLNIVELLIGDAQEVVHMHGVADGAQKLRAARDAERLDAGA